MVRKVDFIKRKTCITQG